MALWRCTRSATVPGCSTTSSLLGCRMHELDQCWCNKLYRKNLSRATNHCMLMPWQANLRALKQIRQTQGYRLQEQKASSKNNR
eukprot:1139927-Pelagomonas_calceolata.AAC.2